MKKHFVKVLSIVMALTMVLSMFGPIAATAQTNTEHDHSHDDVECNHIWSDVIVDDLKCDVNGDIVDGCIYRKCTVEGCGEKQNIQASLAEAIDKYLGVGCRAHGAYEYKIVKAPSCTTDGEAEYVCPVCGDGYTDIPVQKRGHIGANGVAWDSAWYVKTPANCTTAGVKARKCDRCGIEETQAIDPLNHKLSNGQSAYVKIDPSADCDCAAKKVPANTPIEQASTCYQEGWVYKHCTLCHNVEKFPAEKTEHNWKTVRNGNKVETYYERTEGTSIYTCTNAVQYWKVCDDCGYREEDLTHPLRKEAKGHRYETKNYNGANPESSFTSTKGWEKVVDSTKPSCDPDSVNYYIRECLDCPWEENVNYFVDAHTMTKYVCDTHTNCTNCTDAGRELVCAKCGKKDSDAVFTDHEWKQGLLVKAATCIAPAIYEFTCKHANCGEKKNDNVGDPTPNASWDSGAHKGLQTYEHQDPTCKDNGSFKGYCNDCFKPFDVVIPKTPNNHTGYVTKTPAKAPTCMEAGNTLEGYGPTCGHVDEYKILPKDKNNHSGAGCTKQTIITVEATCAHGKFDAVIWSKCGLTETVTINSAKDYTKHYSVTITWELDSATGVKKAKETKNNFKQIVSDVVAPTCTVDGTHEYTYCEGCERIISINYTSCAAKGCKLTLAQHKAAFDKYLGKTKSSSASELDIAKLGHDFSLTTKRALAETCNAPGNVAEIYCQRDCCKNVAAGTDVGTGATLKDGKVYKVVNGVIQDGHSIAPHGTDHDGFWENKTAKAPTCTENGYRAGKFCTKCPATGCDICESNDDVIPAIGHTIKVHKVIAATTTSPEYTIYKCSNKDCFDMLKKNSKVNTTGAAAGMPAYSGYIWYGKVTAPELPVVVNNCKHTATTKTTTPATCVTAGATVTTCDACGEVTDTVAIDAKGHRNAAGNVIYLDCLNYKTYEGQVCVECGVEAGDLVYHDFKFVHASKATCELAEKCSDCKIKVDYVMYEAFYSRMYGENLLPATYKAPEKMTTEAQSEALYVKTVKFVPATSTADGSWEWLCVCGDKHVTPIKFEYSITFDVDVKPYTVNEDAVAEDLVFVNGGLVEVLVSATAEDLVIKGLTYSLNYNADVFEFVSAEIVYDDDVATDGIQNDFGAPIVTDNGGNIKVLGMMKVGVKSIRLNGEKAPMFKFVFRLGEGTKSIAKTDITLVDPQFDASVNAKVTNNQLKDDIKVALMGDLDNNGAYTVDDVIVLQYIINNNGYNNAADFNNDGKCSLVDFGLFAKFITSNMTVADYYTLLGTDIAAEINGYAYADYNKDGSINALDAAKFAEEFNKIVSVTATWSEVLGKADVDSILAATDAAAKN